MSDPKTAAAEPNQGGSFTRDPITGELTQAEATGAAQSTLRRHADDEHPVDGSTDTTEEA